MRRAGLTKLLDLCYFILLNTMYLLAVDTATNAGGVALSRNEELIGLVMMKTPLRYSERIIYYVDFILRQHELQLEDVDCFAVATGPGSFTGLRIGIATVKAFSQGLSKPVVGISTLMALAYRFRSVDTLVAPMIDARRQQVFAAVYRVGERQIETEAPEAVSRPEAWLKNLTVGNAVFVGDGAQLYRNAIRTIHPEARILETDNGILAPLSLLAYGRFKAGGVMTAEELRANYIRPSDAELSKKPGA